MNSSDSHWLLGVKRHANLEDLLSEASSWLVLYCILVFYIASAKAFGKVASEWSFHGTEALLL